MSDYTLQPSPQIPEESTRVALLVEYCGQSFRGSQFQPGLPTVQQSLQEALRALNLKTSAVTFAGRTDAGVNAHGQVAHFDVSRQALENIPNLAVALNAVLPETVSIRNAHVNTGESFHSRRDAAFKWYRYRIHNSLNRSVWASREASVQYRNRLDAERMNTAAQMLLGVHDFKSFKDSDTDVTDDRCDVRYASVTQTGDCIIFDVVANRFLYKMVRNIAGQLMEIGQADKLLSAETILQVLSERDRTKAAFTARPEGLSLMAVAYPSPYDFFAADDYVRQLETILKPTKMESLHNENLFRKAS